MKQILDFFQSLKVLDQEVKSYAIVVSKHSLHSCIVLVIQQLNLILTSISKSLCILMFSKNKDSQNPPARESTVAAIQHILCYGTLIAKLQFTA